MSKRIAAVPATISRKAYVDMWAGLGIDAAQIKSAVCGINDVVAEVFALNENGQRYVLDCKAHEGGDAEVATHTVCIKVADS